MAPPNGHCPGCSTPYFYPKDPDNRFCEEYVCDNGHEYTISTTILVMDTPNLRLVFTPNNILIDFEHATEPDIDISH